MPGRIPIIVKGEIYHIFNRGTEKRDIFLQPRDYKRFLQTLYYYQFMGPKPRFSLSTKSKLNLFEPNPDNQLVEIISYCLMPNHFHLLVRQLKENGIAIFMSQLANSYTRYFNNKYERVGPLLQGAFKAVYIETNEQLLQVSRYIHLNPIVADLVKDLDQYPWSSYFEYVYHRNGYCNPKEVLNFFQSTQQYDKFLRDYVEYGRSLHVIKHQLIDLEG